MQEMVWSRGGLTAVHTCQPQGPGSQAKEVAGDACGRCWSGV